MKPAILFFAISLASTIAHAQSYADSIALHRAAYKLEFVTEERSPLQAADTGFLRFYPVNKQYRVLAKLTRTDSAAFDMKTHTGVIKSIRNMGLCILP